MGDVCWRISRTFWCKLIGGRAKDNLRPAHGDEDIPTLLFHKGLIFHEQPLIVGVVPAKEVRFPATPVVNVRQLI
jgi:hypothetical protein